MKKSVDTVLLLYTVLFYEEVCILPCSMEKSVNTVLLLYTVLFYEEVCRDCDTVVCCPVLWRSL